MSVRTARSKRTRLTNRRRLNAPRPLETVIVHAAPHRMVPLQLSPAPVQSPIK